MVLPDWLSILIVFAAAAIPLSALFYGLIALIMLLQDVWDGRPLAKDNQ